MCAVNNTFFVNSNSFWPNFGEAYKLIIIAISTMSLISTQALSQNGKYSLNPTTNEISNLHAKMNFQYACIWDYDLDKQTDRSAIYNSIVIIDIDSSGTGRLVFFFKSKIIFTIRDCRKINQNFEFTLINYQGKKVNAKLVFDNSNSVHSFMLDNDSDNTAIVLFN